MKLKKIKDNIGTIGLYTLFSFSVLLFIFTFTNINKLFLSPLVRNEAPVEVDVIIVLGGGVVEDSRSLPWSVQERVRKAIDLYQAGYIDNMILAGGLVKGQSYSESEIMRVYAEILGVAPGDIFEESASRDTYENAINSINIMKQSDWSTAMIVTSDYHTKRACKVFEKQKLEIECISAPRDEGFKNDPFRRLIDSRSIFREYFATVYYFVRGYI